MNKQILNTCRTVIDALTQTEPQPPGGPTDPTAWHTAVAERLRQQHWTRIRTEAEAGDPATIITARIARTLAAPTTDPTAGQQAAFNARCAEDAARLEQHQPGVPMPNHVRQALHQ